MHTLALENFNLVKKNTRAASNNDYAYPSQTMDAFLASVEKRAFRIANLSTRNEHDALDIVQNSMIKLVQKYVHRPSHEWPMLFHRILKNCIFDWHRHQKVKRIFSHFTHNNDDALSDSENEYPDHRQVEPDKHVIAKQTIHSIEAALTALPARQRQVFLLRAWEEFDTKTTAKIMGCSEGSVKTHYSRATQRLKTMLEGQIQ